MRPLRFQTGGLAHDLALAQRRSRGRHVDLRLRRRERLALSRSVAQGPTRSEEHTSELQSQSNLVCRLLLEKKKRPHGPTQSNRLSHACRRQGPCRGTEPHQEDGLDL